MGKSKQQTDGSTGPQAIDDSELAVLTRLTSLPAESLKRINATVLTMLGESASVADKQSDDEVTVYRAMSDAMAGLGSKAPPLSVFAKGPSYARFVKLVPDIVEFVNDNFHPKTRIQRQSILQFLFKMLGDGARKNNIPLSARSMVNRLPYLVDYVDQQFPGYREARMLPMVLMQLRKAS